MGGSGRAPSKRAAPKGIDRDSNGSARELGHERAIEIQRGRLLAALFEVSTERGAGNVAVAHVVERAGVCSARVRRRRREDALAQGGCSGWPWASAC